MSAYRFWDRQELQWLRRNTEPKQKVSDSVLLKQMHQELPMFEKRSPPSLQHGKKILKNLYADQVSQAASQVHVHT
jgi:hypothetical protein